MITRTHVNLNDKVYVRLTERGKEVAKNFRWPLSNENLSGWTAWNLWELMAVFGPSITESRHSSLFEGMEIVIESEKK